MYFIYYISSQMDFNAFCLIVNGYGIEWIEVGCGGGGGSSGTAFFCVGQFNPTN